MSVSTAVKPSAPVLTVDHVAKLGAAAVRNLAELAFTRAHRPYPQYRGWLANQDEVFLARITHDPAPAAGTFSRYEVGDVLLAWRKRSILPGIGFTSDVTAFAPRMGWNLALTPGCWEPVR